MTDLERITSVELGNAMTTWTFGDFLINLKPVLGGNEEGRGR